MSSEKVEFGALDQTSLEALARRLAGFLEPGDAVILSGEVGAGKTTFVRAACPALGVRERVSSPTYQIARSYNGSVGERPVTVNHLDLYRLEGVGVEDALDLDEFLTSGAITFIEWAEPALDAVQSPSTIVIEHESPETRNISAFGPLARRVAREETV